MSLCHSGKLGVDNWCGLDRDHDGNDENGGDDHDDGGNDDHDDEDGGGDHDDGGDDGENSRMMNIKKMTTKSQ